MLRWSRGDSARWLKKWEMYVKPTRMSAQGRWKDKINGARLWTGSIHTGRLKTNAPPPPPHTHTPPPHTYTLAHTETVTETSSVEISLSQIPLRVRHTWSVHSASNFCVSFILIHAQRTRTDPGPAHCSSCYDFPKASALSSSGVENREAKDRGQGAARDSPRCLSAPGRRTKPVSLKRQRMTQCSFSPTSLRLFPSFYDWCFKTGRSIILLRRLRSPPQQVAGGTLLPRPPENRTVWRHAGNFHGAAFDAAAWNSRIKDWIQKSMWPHCSPTSSIRWPIMFWISTLLLFTPHDGVSGCTVDTLCGAM